MMCSRRRGTYKKVYPPSLDPTQPNPTQQPSPSLKTFPSFFFETKITTARPNEGKEVTGAQCVMEPSSSLMVRRKTPPLSDRRWWWWWCSDGEGDQNSYLQKEKKEWGSEFAKGQTWRTAHLLFALIYRGPI